MIDLKTYLAVEKKSEIIVRILVVCHLEINETPNIIESKKAMRVDQNINWMWKPQVFLSSAACFYKNTFVISAVPQKQTP